MRRYVFLLLSLILSCESSVKELPVLSYTIDASGHKKYHNITYDDFTNQLGASFTTEDITTKVFISNFFFTRCPSICPPMRTQLIDIAGVFEANDDFLIISHTIDQDHDSVTLLKSYGDATGVPSSKWQFLRASEVKTKLQAKQYMTNFRPNDDGTDFYHSSFVALVDKQQRIRGFYNILLKEEVELLKTDIKTLLD